MDDQTIKKVLDIYEIENSEKISKALAEVFKLLARDSIFVDTLSKAINEKDRRTDRMSGINR
ncbi:hypothetical protein IR117_01100 [Streptococcus danieliae]|nr:hypothetical protein [Streptococcus danieliae]